MTVTERIQKVMQRQPNGMKVILAKLTNTNPIEITIIGDEKIAPSNDRILVTETIQKYTKPTAEVPLRSGQICVGISFSNGQNYLLIDRVGGA